MNKTIGKVFLHYKKGNHDLCKNYITKKLTIHQVFKQGKLLANDSKVIYKYIGSSINIDKYSIESNDHISSSDIIEHTKKMINVAIKYYVNANFWGYVDNIKNDDIIKINVEVKLDPITKGLEFKLE